MKNNLGFSARLWAAFILCLGTSSSMAQIKPIVAQSATRAVIVGISDYQNEQITDLQFADVDARQFAAFLQSPAGGSIPASNIQILTNEKATQAQMAAALTWLVEESKPNDKAIIYFSGHGDMETLTGLSFLLAYNASANAYSGGGGFPVIFLQSIITRLSTQKQVQVLLLTDACRAGKLAGNEINGTQATAKVLSDQFANEVKILSCQPNEYSLESKAWGGGRGVFSYYLIDGLKGLADNNHDQQVSLLELSRFLEDQVPTAVAPHSQIPMVVGNKATVLSQVHTPTLMALEAEKQKNKPASLEAIASRSVSAAGTGDSTTERLIRQFEKALVDGRLLAPGDQNAYALYQQLQNRPDAQPQLGLLRRNLAAKLQDDAQVAINDYLAADPQEMKKRWGFDQRYEQYPRYLGKSAELLGPDHFMYQTLKAREHYFAGLNLRLNGEKTGDKVQFERALQEQQKAIAIDSNAVFAFNEMGHLNILLNQYQASIPFFEKAIALSPTWVLPWSNLSYAYYKMKDWTKAENIGLKAVSLDSTFLMALCNLGRTYQKKQQHEQAIYYFEKTVAADTGYHWAFFNIGLSQFDLGAFQQAESSFLKYKKVMPNDPDAYQVLGETMRKQARLEEAEAYYKKAIALSPQYSFAYFSLGELAQTKKTYADADKYFKKYQDLEPNDAEGYLKMAAVLAAAKKSDQAIVQLKKAFEKGFKDVQRIEKEDSLAPLKTLPGYPQLIEQLLQGN